MLIGKIINKELRLALLSVLLFSGCTFNAQLSKESKDPTQDLSLELSDSRIIYKYNGGRVKASEISQELAPELKIIKEQILSLYKKKGLEIIEQRLLSEYKSNQGNQEALKLISKPIISDVTVTNFLKTNKLGPEQSEKAKQFLIEQSELNKKKELMDALKSQRKVEYVLHESLVKNEWPADAPTRGSAKATVRIEVYCDFANPICWQASQLIQELYERHSPNLSWTFRFLPSKSNLFSEESAKLGICRHLKGDFWSVHDDLFARQGRITQEVLSAIASRYYQTNEFDSICLNNPQTKKILEGHIQNALQNGISSTPTFLVNEWRTQDMVDFRKRVNFELNLATGRKNDQ